LTDIETRDNDELENYIRQKQQHEQDTYMMLWKMLRWHAVTVLKAFSKEGIKPGDLILPDEKEHKITKAKKLVDTKETEEYFDRIDQWMKNKHKNNG
jgi:hypothetical protein